MRGFPSLPSGTVTITRPDGLSLDIRIRARPAGLLGHILAAYPAPQPTYRSSKVAGVVQRIEVPPAPEITETYHHRRQGILVAQYMPEMEAVRPSFTANRDQWVRYADEVRAEITALNITEDELQQVINATNNLTKARAEKGSGEGSGNS